MQEAKEAAKLKIKQIEIQKKEAKRMKSRLGSSYPAELSPTRVVPVETISLSQPTHSTRLGKGMKLGRKM